MSEYGLHCSELQENLIRSHAAGVGSPLTPDKVRRFMALRINVLAKGFSGISLTVLQQFIAAFNGTNKHQRMHVYRLNKLSYLCSYILCVCAALRWN